MAVEAPGRAAGVLPEGWRMVTFGEVVRNVDAQEREALANGIDRYVGLEHVEPRNLHIKSWGNVADGTTFTRRFRPGQVLFGKRRAYQRKAAVAEFDGICSGDILVFESKNDELVPELLPFIVESDGFFEHALRTSAGSLSPRTKWKELADYAFPLPPKPEQQRIAEILWAADASVERWRETLTSSAQLIETGRREAFFSTRWTEVHFESLCLTGPQNGLTVPKDSRQGSVDMVNMGNIFTNEIVSTVNLEPVSLTTQQAKKFQLCPGDLLFARRSIVLEGAGRCSIVPNSHARDLTFESSIIRATLDPSVCSPRFYLHYFRSQPGQARMASIARRGAVAGIAGSDLKKMKVPLPDLAEQVSIAIQLDAMQAFQQATVAHLDKACDLAGRVREQLLAGQGAMLSV